ncbi:class I adenylate-forming enzyme family protein [Variovorax sp. PBL-E5]|uniref:class I adenylate-forming enzyme family protein n=1 Tax=Variovorax sp. PBL-E5 TaxID=434014 RepID=UPI0013A58E33|nr:class I adenylate-forming enzyme family protein [Variovorax sp. PBL-E5]
MNFALFLDMKVRSDPDRLAVADHRLRLCWSELDRQASRLAYLMRARGLAPGDRLAIYLPNRVEVVVALLACLKSGVIATPLNWRLSGAELHRVVSHCAPALTLTSSDRIALLGPGASAAGVLGVDEAPGGGSFWAALEGQPDRFATIGRQAGDIANLLYTSGTTSTPKAAIHTHGMRVAVAAAMTDAFALSSRDVALAVSPLFHTAGLSVFANALFAGCPLILLEKWNLEDFVRIVAEEGVSFMHLIGTLLVDIANADEQIFDPLKASSRVRFTWGGGHSISPDKFLSYERRIGGLFLLGYSRTEGGLSYNPLDAARRNFSDHGFPNRNSSELAIIDPATQRPCNTDVTGEICFRGDGVSPGYWDGHFLRTVPPYDGGWQPTGDLGCVDAEGRLYFLGRGDHMIKTGGENVFPDEVASVLLGLNGVVDAVVVGLPDERMGQRVAALVVPAGPALHTEDLIAGCRLALAGYKTPRVVGFIDALPKLGSGKVDLAACRSLLLAKAAAPTPC